MKKEYREKVKKKLGIMMDKDNYEESEEGGENAEDKNYEEGKGFEAPIQIDESRLEASCNAITEKLFGEKEDWQANVKQYWQDYFVEVRGFVSKQLEEGSDDSYFYLFNYVVNLKDRPNELHSAFRNYKSILYKTLSKETYEEKHLNEVVDGLLMAYDDVGTDSEKLNGIYQVMRRNPEDTSAYSIAGYLPGLKKYCSPYALRELKRDKVFCAHSSDLVWFYSFWGRRYKDGSIQEAVSILKEIKAHYK